ncbi:MAG: phage holin family protein [Gammaproteobacteria bacterium]|nr:phage holin family protein [Gammaproteobacteria bacterium]
MTNFFLRAAIAALGLWLATELIDGLRFDGPASLVLAAVLLGLVNAVVRPLIVILTLPLTILTLGLFLLVVNGICLALVAGLLPGFSVDAFRDACLGAIVVSLVSWVGSWIFGPRGSIEITIHRKD